MAIAMPPAQVPKTHIDVLDPSDLLACSGLTMENTTWKHNSAMQPWCSSLILLSEAWAKLGDQWWWFLTWWWRGVELSPTLAAGWWQLSQAAPVACDKKGGRLRLWQAWSSFSIAPTWQWPSSHRKHEMCGLKHHLCWAWLFYLGLLWSGGLWAPSPSLVCIWAWWKKVHMVQGEGEDPRPVVELGFLLHTPW